MARVNVAAIRRRVKDYFVGHVLNNIPCLIGKLFYIADNVCEVETGSYEHAGACLLVPAGRSGQVPKSLAELHFELFMEWLGGGLDDKRRDLERYLEVFGGNRNEVWRVWSELKNYQRVIPSRAKSFQRDLFVADFEALLAIGSVWEAANLRLSSARDSVLDRGNG